MKLKSFLSLFCIWCIISCWCPLLRKEGKKRRNPKKPSLRLAVERVVDPLASGKDRVSLLCDLQEYN